MNRIYAIVALALALALSLVLNASQFLSKYKADIEAPLVAKIEAQEHAESIAVAVSKARAADQLTIAKLQRDIDTRQVETVTVYRDRVRTLPAPSCAPGADRVSAWNSITLEAAR